MLLSGSRANNRRQQTLGARVRQLASHNHSSPIELRLLLLSQRQHINAWPLLLGLVVLLASRDKMATDVCIRLSCNANGTAPWLAPMPAGPHTSTLQLL